MTEEVYYPESIFDGLSFVGGLVSLILSAFTLVVDRINKKQFDKKVVKFMLSKQADYEHEEGPAKMKQTKIMSHNIQDDHDESLIL